MSLYNEHILTNFFPVLISFLSYEPAKIRQNNMDHPVPPYHVINFLPGSGAISILDSPRVTLDSLDSSAIEER